MKDEAQLLKAARQLDEKALLEIFDTYAPKVYAHALQQGHDPEKADDLVSEVFARLLEELARGQAPSDHLLTYLYQAADRLAKDWEMGVGLRNK